MKESAVFKLLQILQEETAPDHPMSQAQLRARMEERFQIPLNRRTLRSYLNMMLEAGYPIEHTDFSRTSASGETETLCRDWYYVPDLETAEARMLLDLLDNMQGLPAHQREDLREKILAHTSQFTKIARHNPVNLTAPVQKQLLYTVDTICEAIDTDRKVSFAYSSYVYDPQKGLYTAPRLKKDTGRARRYVVSPYEIAITHGKYYLICCTDPYTNVSHYRIDRMRDINILKKPGKPIKEVEGLENGELSLPTHVAEHLFMFTGAPVECEFLILKKNLNDVVDWFGTSVEVNECGDPDRYLIRLSVNETAMQYWALQYGEAVTVLKPDTLRESIRETLEDMRARYEDS